MDDSCIQLFLRRKLAFFSMKAAFYDFLVAFVFGLLAGLSIIAISNNNEVTGEISSRVTWFIRDIASYTAIAYLANTFLIASPWQATLGMKLTGHCVESFDRTRPSITQAFKFSLVSPIFLPFLIFNAYSWIGEAPLNVYYFTNAFMLMVGCQALLIILCKIIFGNLLNARQSLSGLAIKFTPKNLLKYESKAVAKADLLQGWLPWLRYCDIGVTAIFLAILLYFPVILIVDQAKNPMSGSNLYDPYEINWGSDNAYFALRGLTAPVEIQNYYEFGKSFVYRDFTQMENIKEKVGIHPRFDIPVGISFEQFRLNAPKLKFQGLNIKEDEREILGGCRTVDKYVDTPEGCYSSDEITALISKNMQLWERFNSIPSYKLFSVPPEPPSTLKLDEYLARGVGRGDTLDPSLRRYFSEEDDDTLINLAQLKIAEIFLLQKNGKSEVAYQEWAKFMSLYSQMIGLKTSIENKAISMILFGMHASALETLLYYDPALVQKHYDEIESLLNIASIERYRAPYLLADNYAAIEPILLYEVGSSEKIQSEIHKCLDEQVRLAAESAKEYFEQKNSSLFCPSLSTGNKIDRFWDWSFRAPSNLWADFVWSLNVSSELKVVQFIDNMHIQIAETRLALLGVKVLKQNIPFNQIGAFVRSSPIELYNPLDETPFKWDEDGSYLWFEKPNDSSYRIKFHINPQR